MGQEELKRRPEEKHSTQIISMIVGIILCILGLAGLLNQSFAGLHLGAPYSTIIAASGALLLYFGYNNNSRDAFVCCLGFAVFYGLHAIAGWVFGTPGVPSVGYDRPDPDLIRIIPRIHELGKHDHVLNTILTLVLAGGAADWWRRKKSQKGVMRVIREFIDDHREKNQPKRPVHH
ncbi:hypothetical protein [Peredibacter starrii]|uniref:Uncharacterized protein n=1 Tax=Peredibacter starrii TaxID=28202 RepID=A0AAX4HLM6_9BACT|nr:hypothetical protein [Peredibacter starrii]WPU64067.1 hypothetical protein SOO65_15330 [Peredibacter starrii]